ncbi:PaaI family thioesterase [Sphingomonas naphthae]|uniref:PaaI family thioesterase n=1 Tax=Sphingomonas naphthae TaxID=1813468 RepID=A0ABY7TKG7_9SPHN|nr:PaaI family thioesterase [Sphingomonas naphthae]WCT73700.1 PaaI family thioesterase [Sphingomonas naphthae]
MSRPELTIRSYAIDDVFGPPDAEGFRLFHPGGDGGHNKSYPPIRCRVEGDRSRARVETGPDNANLQGALHGGFLLSLVDQLLFLGPALAGQLPLGAVVTIDAGVKFIGGGKVGEPIDAVVERIAETGRMIFLRGTMTQGERIVATFEGTMRKMTPNAA